MGQKFYKQTLRLKDEHTWKAKPGNMICVIDRGAVRFDYPGSWDMTIDDGQINLRDRPQPDDNCVLSVSHMQIPVELADQLPVRELVEGARPEEDGEVLERKPAVDVARDDGIELAYAETRYIQRQEKREAISRLAVGRSGGIYCLITFAFWTDDFAKCEPVWQEALRSLTLGQYATDPTTGPMVH
ncbi:MAG: hypothetical protein JO336_09930 [Acidobacteriia bacterium]|nr:hypothetical protein [Terriglobia bacterium]